MTDKQDIIFLIRAYNDLDIQLPFIAACSEDGRFKIRVIGYPCDGDMGSPQSHEATRYMRDKFGVQFETVLDKAPAPLWLRLLYNIERLLALIRNQSWACHKILGLPIKAVHVAILMLMRRSLRGTLPWLDKVTETWNPLFLSVDEALAQGGRSYMLDKIVRQKAEQGVPVYIIKTGNDTYLDTMPNKSRDKKTTLAELDYRKTPARRYIVPSILDLKAAKEFFPEESPEVHGNLRMDRNWIKQLHEEILVPPYMDKSHYMGKLPKGGGPRVVFMLSKLGYGIRVDELKNTIRTVVNIHGIQCAIKPHTRGMKFDFMKPEEIQGCAIVPDVPSTLLIEWADIILFTGSSIAFHAMVLDKRVGLLQNCQYIETIFDDGQSCDLFNNVSELDQFLKQWRDQGEPEVSKETLEGRKDWQAKVIHGGLKTGLTAQHYKDVYFKDLGVEDK